MKKYEKNCEKIPLCKDRRYGYTSRFRRYNKIGIINFLSCAMLVILATTFIMLSFVYFGMENKPLNPLETNGSFWSHLYQNGKVFGWNMKQDEISEAFNLAKLDLTYKERLDRENPTIGLNTPSYRHQQTLKGETGSYVYAEKGYLMNRAVEHLIRNHPERRETIYDITTHNWLNLEFCINDTADCDLPYRTMSGYCNNKKHATSWGVAMRPFRRDLPADYCNGIGSPRCAKDKTSLPSSRLISLKLHRPEYKTDPKFTYMFAVWGQFIDHDITSTALNKGVDGQFLSCCGGINHPECYPVNISTDDTYYSKFSVTCMEFVRSAPAPTCKLGQREQLNQVTSYLDGSAVYGSNEKFSFRLRDFLEGKLRMFYTLDCRTLLPISTDLNDGCNREEEMKKGRYCFLAGDSRANENIHLTSIHLIMARQHNRLASNLSTLNPDWKDEKIYQESRRILIAQMQHITYNEFLKPLLGEETMEKYRLNPEDYEYNEEIDASMSNNFAAAAFRFAHTLLPKLMKIAANNTMSPELILLHKMLFNPFQLYDAGSLDSVIYGAVNTRTDKLDRFFNTEITQHLFQDLKNVTNKTCGLDLVTLNLQRGRDHGLPGYTKWREFCNLSLINSFSDLYQIMDKDSVDVLKIYYKDVEDIDLYSGALSENPIKNAILGPTATCLIAKQFHKIKFGDRYWYETTEQPQGFTKEQLREIKKTTLSKIICDNSDSIEYIRRYVMEIMEGNSSDQIRCDSLEEINLHFWSDSHRHLAGPSMKENEKTPSVIKLYASTSLITGEIFGSYDNGELVRLFDGTLPAEVYVDNFTDPNGYDVSATIEWQGVAVNNSLSGSYSLPVVMSNGLNLEVKYWKGNFTAFVKYKWGGSLNIIEPNKVYKCKLMFNEYNKKATFTQLGKTVKDPESCTIMLAGYFYKKPFYCILAFWWCTDEKIFYWSGDSELIIRKLATHVTTSETMNYKADPLPKLDDNTKILKGILEDEHPKAAITRIKTTITGGEILGFDDDDDDDKVLQIFVGKFPVTVNVDITDSLSFDISRVFSNNSISGTFIFPETKAGKNKYSRGNFTLNIDYLQFPLFLMETHVNYTCKVMLNVIDQPSFKERGDSEEDNCIIIVDLRVYKPSFYCYLMSWFCNNVKEYYWNGDVEVILKSQPLNYYPKKDYSNYINDYKNDTYQNTFVNLHRHTIDGRVRNGYVKIYQGKKLDFWTGSLPVDIHLPLFWQPFPDLNNLHDNYTHGVLFSCSFFQSSIKGTFKLPQYTKFGLINWASGTFSFEVTPLKGGTLYDMLMPDYEYYSSIHFHDIDKRIPVLQLANGKMPDETQKMNMKILILGKHNYNLNTFTWNGKFYIIIDNVPYMQRLI